MSAPDFYVLQIGDISPEEIDLVSAVLFEAGAAGTEEILAFEQKSRDYEPVTLQREKTNLRVYFTDLPARGLIESLRAEYPHLSFTVSQESSRDWLAEWKKGFEPFRLAGDTWIVPSWRESPAEAKQVIRIDPGMAFGTGTHETTRLAAGFLQDYGSQDGTRGALFDVGTGTGILAMLAELLGFAEVYGNDIDEEARRVARENAALNRMSRVRIVDDEFAEVEGSFEWVVANIIDGVLVRLQKDLRDRVKPGGRLLLTGILAERDEVFRLEFSFAGFDVVERRQLGEWIGYLLQRSAPTRG